MQTTPFFRFSSDLSQLSAAIRAGASEPDAAAEAYGFLRAVPGAGADGKQESKSSAVTAKLKALFQKAGSASNDAGSRLLARRQGFLVGLNRLLQDRVGADFPELVALSREPAVDIRARVCEIIDAAELTHRKDQRLGEAGRPLDCRNRVFGFICAELYRQRSLVDPLDEAQRAVLTDELNAIAMDHIAAQEAISPANWQVDAATLRDALIARILVSCTASRKPDFKSKTG